MEGAFSPLEGLLSDKAIGRGEAVRRSVEAAAAGRLLEFLSDNGGAYIAHDTHAVARSLGLTPIHKPVCSPQSNRMAESFVNTFRRDCVARMDLSDAATVLLSCQAPSNSSTRCIRIRV